MPPLLSELNAVFATGVVKLKDGTSYKHSHVEDVARVLTGLAVAMDRDTLNNPKYDPLTASQAHNFLWNLAQGLPLFGLKAFDKIQDQVSKLRFGGSEINGHTLKIARDLLEVKDGAVGINFSHITQQLEAMALEKGIKADLTFYPNSPSFSRFVPA